VGTIEAYYLMSIAIDSKDAIYVLDLGATVQKFDETETVPSWTVVGVPNILKQTNGLSLAIDSNDVIYVAAAGQMKRFDGTSWVTVGRPLSQGNSNASGSLAIGTDNVPVMAYNRSPDNKATVVKLGITIPNFTTMSVCPLHNLNMCDMCAGMMDMCVQMGF
jgi:hypothetical protein